MTGLINFIKLHPIWTIIIVAMIIGAFSDNGKNSLKSGASREILAKFNAVDTDYKFYTDGSCENGEKEICIDGNDAKLLCDNLVGITQRAVDMWSVSSEKARQLIKAGELTPFKASWNGHSCVALMNASGIYNGSSDKVVCDGRVSSFIVSSGGEPSASYIDGFCN